MFVQRVGGRPNYICRCQSVVNNPESPPRPTSSHHLPFLLLCVQNISCQDVGAVHGMRLAAVQGEEASSGSYFRRGLRVRATLLPRYNQPPLTAATYHLTNQSSPGDQSGGSSVIRLVQEFTAFSPTTAETWEPIICGLAICTRNSNSI